MRKIVLAVLLALLPVVCLLNMRVYTRQGVNYQWHVLQIPLYLKLLDFFDRHYNYSELVKRVNAGAVTEAEKMMRLFAWTSRNIRHTPEGLPVVDDHVWHIIIRGYGASDQYADVFTTLCSYAGLSAFYFTISSSDGKDAIILSAVKINSEWFVFDLYRSAYFIDMRGSLIDVDALRAGVSWKAVFKDEAQALDYGAYFKSLPAITAMPLQRASIQSPLRRMIFFIREKVNMSNERGANAHI